MHMNAMNIPLSVCWDDVQYARQLLLVHLATCYHLPSFTHYLITHPYFSRLLIPAN